MPGQSFISKTTIQGYEELVFLRELWWFLASRWWWWMGVLVAGAVFLLYLAYLSAWECEHHPVARRSDFCQKIALMRMENDGT